MKTDEMYKQRKCMRIDKSRLQVRSEKMVQRQEKKINNWGSVPNPINARTHDDDDDDNNMTMKIGDEDGSNKIFVNSEILKN